MSDLTLQPQEIPENHPDACNFFLTSDLKPFVMTSGAIDLFGEALLLDRLTELQALAEAQNGLDYLQTFLSPDGESLWIEEDRQAITAMLPMER